MDVEAPDLLKLPVVIPHIKLMGPGPSNCSPRVLHAMSQNVLGHMHLEVFKIMDEIKEGIKYVFQTNNKLSLAISGSGHAGMEAVISNLLEKDDKILIATNGIWGVRAANMAERYGAAVSTITTEPGNNFSLDRLENAICSYRPKLLFVIQGESSTGVYQPLEGLGDVCRRYGCLLAVDCVASLGAVPFFMDRWNIDVAYTGSQKIIGAPPGITPISFNDRAQDIIFSRKTPVSVYYWDMTVLGKQWNCFDNVRIYHHTTCSNLLFALREGLAVIAEEGLENVIRRHCICAKKLYDGLKDLNMTLFVKDPKKRLPSVTTVMVPDGIDWKEVVTYAKEKYNLEISGGLGPTVGVVFRIGLMGYNATLKNVDLVLKILQEALQVKISSRMSKL